ncbi:MAG: LysR family transcriptional regulator [Gammaproteobacteria bacterium]|nr:MAG: LysR family transcriptional regulator [Gammaproteobacteria bacterium]
MDWRALQDVVAVAETGSLSGAARLLNVTQPTVGRRIEMLEEQLGVLLFTRTAQGLLLTELGESILHNATRMYEDAQAIERKATGSNQQLSGSVRLSLIEDIGVHWLPDKLAQFHRMYPQLNVEVNIENKNVNLLRREADIAIRLARPEQPDLICRKVGLFRMALFASKQYLSEYGTPEKISDLKSHFLISFDMEYGYSKARQTLESMFEKQNIRHRSNSHLEMVEATLAGIGLSVLSCLIAKDQPNLQQVIARKIFHDQEVWLVTHSEIHKNARIRTMFDFLVKSFETDLNKFCPV